MREVDRHDMEEGSIGPRQFDLDRRGVDDRHARQALGLATGDVVVALDRSEEAGPRALSFGVRHAIERVLDVFRGHLAAVVEFHAFAQLEGERGAVRRNLVAFSKFGPEIRGARFVVHQAVEQALDHGPVLPVIADSWVERRDIVLVCHDDFAARLGFWVALLLSIRRH